MNIAVILAGGVGSRVGARVPKQFIEVMGKPVLAYTVEAFQNHPQIDGIEVVCIESYMDYMEEMKEKYGFSKLRWVARGGKDFQESVMNGINHLEGIASEDDFVLVHFGASPFIEDYIITDAIRVCRETGNAIATTDFFLLSGFKDEDKKGSSTWIDRDTIACMSTPHAFRYGFIHDIYKEAVETGLINEVEPHTTTLMYKMGKKVYFSEGSQTNIKITRKEDLDLFEGYLMMKEKRKKEKARDMIYDYLVVGAGLYGAVFAHEAKKRGKKVLVIDKRSHIAGNVYTEDVEGIHVHKYGAHIFHTNSKRVWDYVNQFATFNRFTNSPVANYHGELYSLPFNMYTFNKMWGVVTPQEAAARIEEQKKQAGITEPGNLEEQAISLVGTDIYEKLVKGYTEKQWGRPCKDLPAFIIRRLPVRFTFDNNYFNALYQGIPVGGYTRMVDHMLEGIEVRLNTDYLADKEVYDAMAEKVIYTGPIDAYFDYSLGNLEYRSVRFENELLDMPNFQGNAAVNYTDAETPWTRIIEHKWFEFGKDEDGKDLPKTVISREYSSEWKPGDEPYYPVNDEKNGALYLRYKALADKEDKTVFGGRLGEYKYYDMDAVIEASLRCCDQLL